MLTLSDASKAQLRRCMSACRDRPDLKQSLRDNLRFLRDYACYLPNDELDRKLTRCELHPDFALLSFDIVMYRRDANGDYKFWFNGGLILHGVQGTTSDGSAPTFSVSLSNKPGWSIHT